MNTYIGSDFHWGHTNIMKFCPQSRARFKNDVNYMNEQMVLEWNSIVQPEDLVYMLGDIAFLPAQKATEYMRRCNGRKILVRGNHDRKILNDPSFRGCFEEVHSDWIGNINGHYVHMYHFPIMEWDQMHRGALHFHGHLHGGVSGLEAFRARDMGMDATGQIVVPMERAIADALTGKIKGHH